MLEKTEFKTIKTKEIKFGKNNFLEISRKQAITIDGLKPFISLTKGYYVGAKRTYSQTLTLPDNISTVNSVIETLKSVVE